MTDNSERQIPDIFKVNWYPRDFPKEQEAVAVKLTRVDDMGIWVELKQYGSKEGMIPLGQYTTRRSRRVPKSVKVGKLDVALVSQVDEEKGNMDLTRQGLKEEDIKNALKLYEDYRSLMMLLAYTSTETNIPLEELAAKVSYPLHEQTGNAYIALHNSNTKPEIIDNLDVPQSVKESLKLQIQRQFTPQDVRIHSTFEAEIFTTQGVNALREALSSGYEVIDNETLSINVIAPPLYSASMTIKGEDEDEKLLEKVVSKIQENVIKAGGRFLLKVAPKSISQKEIQQLQQDLEELAKGNDNADIDEIDNE